MNDMNNVNLKKYNNKRTIKKIITYIFLTLWALMVLFPFYWMILTSLKSASTYNYESVPTFFIKPTFTSYITAFNNEEINLFRSIFNTLIFTILTTSIMLIVIILAAYSFSIFEFKGKKLAFTLLLSLMMIPTELVIITNFSTISYLNLRNTFTGLILPSVSSIFYLYLLKETFSQVPINLYKAAKVDGISDFKYLFKVIVPICKPTIVTIFILKIIECWNAYVWPRLITDNKNYFLISNTIQEIREFGFGRENVPAMMSSVVVFSLPLIVLFLVFRNTIMTGVSKSGTKG